MELVLSCLCLPIHQSLTLSLALSLCADEGVWESFIRLLPPNSRSVSVPLERLRSGIGYEFRVIAVNRYGYGEPSTPSASLAGKHSHTHTAGDQVNEQTPDASACAVRVWQNF